MVLYGPERFLQVEATRAARVALLSAHGEVTTVMFEGGSARAADILDECRSLSLMQCHKLVIVDNADLLLKGDGEEEGAAPVAPAARGGGGGGKSARELFTDYAAAPDASATLVLRASGRWYPGKLDKAALATGGPGAVRRCDEMKPYEAAAWVARRAGEHGATLEDDAAQALVEAVGADLGRLDTELAKLAMFEPGKPIGRGAVEALTTLTRQEKFWTIQEALASGDAARSLGHLHELLEVSRHNEVPVMTSYIDLARKLVALQAGMRAREPVPSLMGRLQIYGPAAGAMVNAAKRLGPDEAAGLFEAAVAAAWRHRSGQRDPVLLLEELTLRFAGAFGGEPIDA